MHPSLQIKCHPRLRDMPILRQKGEKKEELPLFLRPLLLRVHLTIWQTTTMILTTIRCKRRLARIIRHYKTDKAHTLLPILTTGQFLTLAWNTQRGQSHTIATPLVPLEDATSLFFRSQSAKQSVMCNTLTDLKDK